MKELVWFVLFLIGDLCNPVFMYWVGLQVTEELVTSCCTVTPLAYDLPWISAASSVVYWIVLVYAYVTRYNG